MLSRLRDVKALTRARCAPNIAGCRSFPGDMERGRSGLAFALLAVMALALLVAQFFLFGQRRIAEASARKIAWQNDAALALQSGSTTSVLRALLIEEFVR